MNNFSTNIKLPLGPDNLFTILQEHHPKGRGNNYAFRSFKKGNFVYQPNDRSLHIYMIIRGRIKISKYFEDGQEIIKTILTDGEIFGERALVDHSVQTDYATALEDNTIIYQLQTEVLKELMLSNPELGYRVIKLIGLRFLKMEEETEILRHQNARARIIQFLKNAAKWGGKKVGFEIMCEIKLTHSDIARLVCLSRQTVTTTLNELKKENLIYFDRRKVLIRNIAKLF